MRKTILLAALLLNLPLSGQTTFHKKFQTGLFTAHIPLNNGEIIGINNTSLVKFDPLGEFLFRKNIPAIDIVRNSVQIEGGVIIVGDTIRPINSGNPRHRYAVVSKLDDAWNEVWSKYIGNMDGASSANSVVVVPGGYVVSGTYSPFNLPGQNKCVFTKFDENGNTIWSKSYNNVHPDYNLSFTAQFFEGDTLYACGDIQGNGCMVRINLNNGELLGWSSFGGPYHEYMNVIKPTKDSNFLVAGSTRSTTGSEEDRPWVMKLNRMGQIIWSKTYNIPGTNFSAFIDGTNDGNFILSFGAGTQGGADENRAILAKIDSFGHVLWAYNYSSEIGFELGAIYPTPDGAIFSGGKRNMIKVNSDGRVSNGCCPALIDLMEQDYMPSLQYPLMVTEDWELAKPFSINVLAGTPFPVKDVCEVPVTNIIQQVMVCQGDSVEINGSFYHAPNTIYDTIQNFMGGCDTVLVFNLINVPLPFRLQSIGLCPGTSVEIDGINYSAPTTVTKYLPATTGCDTQLVYQIYWRPLPRLYQTTLFCPGDTVFINGIGYLHPDLISPPDTLLGLNNTCDTLLFHIIDYPSEPSSIVAQCPPDMTVVTNPATPIVVQYPDPIATSTCSCPNMNYTLIDGHLSGTAFPVGKTQVCYAANDVCGHQETCCFEVNVEEENICDVKLSGCVLYELLEILADDEQNKTYRMRITNDCPSPLSYTAFQIPNGLEALSPSQNSTYISPNGYSYMVRNPNNGPFRSVRYKPLGNGISNGQADVFEYTLPAQADQTFIKVTTRLNSGAFYEATLNTFGCAIQADAVADRNLKQPSSLPLLHVFPNPGSGEIYIDLSEWESEIVNLRVLDINGQEMVQINAVGGKTQALPILATFPDGLYFLEAIPKIGETTAIKFVLQR